MSAPASAPASAAAAPHPAPAKPSAKGPAHEHILLGRPSNNLTMGIVGLANVGKSTFFNVLTNSSVRAENFPFCTIDPSTARAQVPDERWEFLCEKCQPQRRIPAFLQVTDIAGLIRGAASGQGLGNAFLSNIQAVDGIFHLVRSFDDEEITHVEGNVDPCRDLDIVSQELRLKDIEVLEKKREPLERLLNRANDKTKKAEFECINKCLAMLQEGRDVRFGDWDSKEVEFVNSFTLLTAKPVVFLVNLSSADYVRKRNRWLAPIKQWVDSHCPGETLIPFSAPFETEWQAMTPEARTAFTAEHPGVTSILPKIILTGYNALSLIHFFTAGADEVKCWTVRRHSKAPRAAGVIHTDFERGFICAEVMSYEDFHQHGSEQEVRAAGKYMTKGKEYEVLDGDILLFKFNAPQQGKKK
ncbi:putative Ribosome-binding ATPase YchF [Paratrimastix pyriformis]|uniref:Obg-like ATPase 1 n=1 Tax=Paratrimastix pyriformis TaxID=342808 RepID=A0ABQ8U9G6_9EUKA|nr:putative Ribosome-binding ATPase YchF [Paratrimastix pyriformis]|eukprot:GAFH01001837.1.p2 GENE.GAFH01001837.1~~GAFH01001837.1.p2  ORF type:complete len:421 (+),score=168.19 GAFH01001837.1:23-1264(+)